MRERAEVYVSSLDTFIERRRALANALRQAGEAAGAKNVGGLPKPSLSAWAVNRLGWSHRDADIRSRLEQTLGKSP